MSAASPVGADDARLLTALAAAGLPTDDLSEGQPVFIEIEGRAFGGLAALGEIGLVRSIVVQPGARGQGLGAGIVAALVVQARAQRLSELWLLTESAAPFFVKEGFAAASRDDAPAAIRATRQFSSLCPQSATLMRRAL